ncbi:DUF421 domain-containing protein [Desulfoscipio geothermicus]|uniref:Uncharacterized membrane protein YcaP, DUF421 family n=1 Tax=Desulfoscipio geothermicus DSM 3669 TaxID=1121426 RepID=A0A1I6DWX0_9FIRM|nr:DUF421 domain-containing protein [Desulfoscipio geothermicus]SFR09831.1 Uncharacterized membrane protein YcaP, DUF421 family [Desulfoscipio geothermicus DSM 3669]
MLTLFIRTVILYLAVVLAMKIMGKRQVGQLQPFELVVILTISAMAAIAMQNVGVPLLNSIIPIITITVMQVILSLINLKSEKARGIICGRPSIVVENGKIVEEELRKLRINVNDLLEQLRAKNYFNIADVEYAILETNGQLSVLTKSQKRPVQPEDLQIQTKYEGLPTTLIIDGKVNYENLKKVNLDESWLKKELRKFGITDVKEVFFASLDSLGNLFYQVKTAAGRGLK